jgi:hypothetical protein
MTIQEMEDLAWEHGAVVVRGPISTAFIRLAVPPYIEFHVIGLPAGREPSEEAFSLAHELGHLLLGHHPKNPSWFVREVQANHWAKKACQSPAGAVPSLN